MSIKAVPPVAHADGLMMSSSISPGVVRVALPGTHQDRHGQHRLREGVPGHPRRLTSEGSSGTDDVRWGGETDDDVDVRS